MRGNETGCVSPDQLAALREGRLDEPRRALLERHVSACPHCASLSEVLSGAGVTRPMRGDDSDEAHRPELPQPTVASGAEPTEAPPPEAKPRRIDLEPGRRLGPYRIGRRLGSGGMGVVYEAFDQERGAPVAMKILPRVDARTLYLFKREFRALADLAHPNLVSLYEFACDDGLWYFTMERVDGPDFLAYVRPEARGDGEESTVDDRSLSTVRDDPGPEETDPAVAPPVALPSTRGEPVAVPEETVRAGPEPPGRRELDLERLRATILGLAAGVEALHEAGKLHRDLKPSNVLVTNAGRVVLLDFGLIAELAIPAFADGPAPQVDDLPSHYGADSTVPEVAGTVAYMAPEQALGEPLTEACDWYAVGVMLYEALAGRRPFVGSSFQTVRDKLAGPPAPPSRFYPSAPPDLESLCMDLLRRHPEDRPSGAEVLRRLGTSPSEAVARAERPPSPRRAPFVGRERPMAELEDAYRAARAGRVVTVLARGASGAGKSALFQRFVETLPADDAPVVLAGRCFERESVPYKALDSLIDALARHLRRLPPGEAAGLMPDGLAALTRIFPVLNLAAAGDPAGAPSPAPATDPQELRRRAVAALRALLGRIAARSPLVLVIDDIQWGDVDSAHLLIDVLRPPGPPPLLLLIAYRGEDVATSPCLRTLLDAWPVGEPGTDRRALAVEAMRPAEAVELAARLIGRDDPEARARAEAIARESGGNPYFIAELVEGEADGDGLGDAPGGPGRIDFDEMVWRRIGRLPEGSRRLLEAIAVAGKPLPLRIAATAAAGPGLGGDGAGRPDAALRAGHLIRGTGPRLDDEVEAYHDRIRETVVAHLRPEALRDRHARLAEALEAAGAADVETLAAHHEGAGAPGRAGAYYARAADAAAEALAFDRAAELYRRSIRLRPPAGDEARALRARLADALANSGRGPEAAEQYLAAAAGAGRRESIDLERKAAFQYCMSGHLDEGQAVLRGVLRRVGMALPRTRFGGLASLTLHRARLRVRGLRHRERGEREVPESILAKIDVSWSVAAGLATKDPIVAPAFQSRNLLLALRAGEPTRLVRALAWEAAHHANLGASSRSRTEALYDAARQVAGRRDEPYLRGFLDLAGSVLEFHRNRWRAGVALGDRAAATFREQCTGAAWELGQAYTFMLWCMSWMGDYAAMARRSAEILAEAEKKGDLFTAANLGGYIQPLGLLARGEADEPLRLIARNVSPWSRSFYHVQHLTSLMASTPVHLYRGDPLAAHRENLAHASAIRRNLILHVQLCRVVVAEMRARAALALASSSPASDRPRLLADAESRARLLDRERVPLASAFARLIRAGVSSLRGDAASATGSLPAVIDAFDALEMGHYAAATRRRLGEIVGGDEGAGLVESSRAWMASREIADPERMADALVPRLAP